MRARRQSRPVRVLPGASARRERAGDPVRTARWKGRLGIEADDEDWFAMVVKEQGLRIDNAQQKIALKFVDPAVVLDEDAKWKKLYAEIVLGNAR
jgi:hypothetical protein